MAEILGPALNLRFYEKDGTFDEQSLFADLGYFVREHGPSLAERLLPDISRELLVRLQYAPDHFSYHLVDGRLVASEDLKNNNLVDAQSRIDPSESLRGAGAHHVLRKLRSWLSDEPGHPDGQAVCWMSPKEGFSEHAYLTVGTIGRDEEGRRACFVTAYMSDFSQEELLTVVREFTGISIPSSTDPKLVSRMLLTTPSGPAARCAPPDALAEHCGRSAGSSFESETLRVEDPLASPDLISSFVISAIHRAFRSDVVIEGVPISRLYGPESHVIWEKIREVVGNGQERITAIIQNSKERVDAMAGTMAQAVFGLIEETIEKLGGRISRIRKTAEVDTRRLLDAFALAVAGCVGVGFIGGGGLPISPVRIGKESDYVHCPNCDREVHCPIGERCPGCRQVRPC